MTRPIKLLQRIGFSIAIVIIGMPFARADIDPGTHILREATPKIVESAIRIFDPKFKEMNDGKGYTFTFEGNTVVVFRTATKIRLGYAFTDKKVTLTRVNEWNRNNGSLRSYIAEEGPAAILASELELKDGVTIGTVGWFFSHFVMEIPDFIKAMK